MESGKLKEKGKIRRRGVMSTEWGQPFYYLKSSIESFPSKDQVVYKCQLRNEIDRQMPLKCLFTYHATHKSYLILFAI